MGKNKKSAAGGPSSEGRAGGYIEIDPSEVRLASDQ